MADVDIHEEKIINEKNFLVSHEEVATINIRIGATFSTLVNKQIKYKLV